jgi:isoquinoline 1-oxidoreductase beta subunit
VKLKPAADFRLIGRPQARLDTPSKVDGTAEFGLDVKLPGMVYAVIALCPTLGGKAAAVDSAGAEALPGVRRVLSISSGIVVVADHFWQALKARNALKITWDPGENAHLDNAAFRASLDRASAAVPGLKAKMTRGDTAAALKNAENTLSAVYELPLLAHATMEPMNCTADVRADHCDLYVGTQVQQGAQAAAADAAGLKPEQVNVYTTLLGGGFGRRLEVDFIPAAVEASKALRVPVKLVWTREDDMTHDFFRPPAREEVSAGFDAHGGLQAFGLHIVSPSITARASPSTVAADPFDSVIEYAQNLPYAVPNYSLSFSRQEIGIDVGYLRSVSHAPNCFAIECFLDELAAAVSKDPLALRLELLAVSLSTAMWRGGRAGAARPRGASRVSRSWRAIPRTLRKWRRSPCPQAPSRSTRSPASSTAARWSIRASSSRRSKAASSTDSRPRSGATSRCARGRSARPTSTTIGCCARTRCPSSTCT